MDRPAFLRGLAAGCPPTLSSADLAAELLAHADSLDVLPHGIREILRQAAARLKQAMTPQEINARLAAIVKRCSANHAYVTVYSFDERETVSARMYRGRDINGPEVSGADWSEALSALETAATSGEGIARFIDGLAKTLIAGGKLSETDEVRYGERARARAREMAEGFMKGAVE